MNLEAVAQLSERFNPLDIVFVESGGDNLAATFSLSFLISRFT